MSRNKHPSTGRPRARQGQPRAGSSRARSRPEQAARPRRAGRRERPLGRIDPRAALEVLTDEILDLKSSTARNLYGLGVRLARIKDEGLWRHGGYRGFEAYLEQAVGMGRTTSYELIRIARHFNAEIAARYGYEKLRAVMAWMAATPDDELPGDLFAADIRLRSAGGRFVSKALHEATATEVREAIVLLKDAQAGSARISRVVKARVRRLEERLPAAPRGTQSGERIRLRRGRDGKLALTFQAIPYDGLEDFIAALGEWLK